MHRFIPVLLIDGLKLVKTISFNKSIYLGDPLNAVKIFNDKRADELMILDISASKKNKEIQWDLLEGIAAEAFMPLSYGGGIKNIKDAKKLFSIGFEKIVINTEALERPELITEISDFSGNQSVVVCIDYKKNIFGNYKVYSRSAQKKTNLNPIDWAIEVVKRGAGEIILQSIERDGGWCGYDLELTQEIAHKIPVPLVPLGGCAQKSDFTKAFNAGAHAVAAGSYFVFSGKNKGILINYDVEF